MPKEDERPAYFAIIPADVRYHTKLAPNAKLLYGEITALADRAGYCWASNKYLADQFRWGERTVSRLIRQMADLALLRIEMVATAKGAERRIYIGVKAAGGVAKIGDTRCSQNWRGGVAKTGDTHNKYNNTQNITPYSPPEGDDHLWEMFDGFWAAYPRKVKKEAARRAWAKLKPDRGMMQAIMRALGAQKLSREWQEDGGKYIPHPSSWLNGKRWEDELPAPNRPAERTESYGWGV